jgi:hypothetical protein
VVQAFKADGAAAAQKWARLMAAKKVAEMKAAFTQAQLEALDPAERVKLFWFVVTNCTRHNFNLGGKHATAAAAKIIGELAAPAVEAMREAGVSCR